MKSVKPVLYIIAFAHFQACNLRYCIRFVCIFQCACQQCIFTHWLRGFFRIYTGAAQENQVFYCTENTTGAPRTGEIVYEYAQHLYRIPITQNANARLILTPQFLSLTYIQGSTTLNAQAPTNNTIFCISWPTWMHPVFNNALQPQNVAFNARGNILFYYDQYLNSFNGPRTGEIVYEYGGIQYAVPVTQYPAM